MIYVLIAAVVLCILCSAFFSASEMSFSSANRIRLENAAEEGNKAAARAVKIIEKFEDPCRLSWSATTSSTSQLLPWARCW